MAPDPSVHLPRYRSAALCDLGDGPRSIDAPSRPSGPGTLGAVTPDSLAVRLARALASWAHSLKPATAARYGREATAFASFIEGVHGPLPEGLLATTPADVRAFVFLIPDQANSTRAVKIATLRAMFSALVVEGLVSNNPARDVVVRNVASGRHHQAVPVEVVTDVLAELAAGTTLRDVRDRAIIITFLGLGLRRSELARLRVRDIERGEDGRTYLNVLGKGDKTTRMVLREGAVSAIGAWMAVAGLGEDLNAHVFFNLSFRTDHRDRKSLSAEGVWSIIRRRFPGYSPHSLRARAVTDVWSSSDGNLHFAQLFARHSNPAVTDRVYVQGKKLEKAMQYAPDYQ